ncbi:alpha/beta hydrolase [Microbacterium sp. CFH 90308]|uniref:Alpha/beta hydrolase n=1 Tax=Microbacterium salsuginis TaxID=2722803 RepID=A0ABX1KEV4_9MICO|nr:alpha/beta hydrolase [Microbacterium sp. CFH 90308]NLP85100.1 alpha/beta hydrolase [Microbacterium sp. CFH 90308]
MPSWQSEAVAAMYRVWTDELNNPNPDRQESRETNDHWGDLTAEPRQVDYLERDIAGTPALWVEPHNANPDRVLLHVHGGGFIGGSLYTHRKLVGHLAKAAGIRALVISYPRTPEHQHPAQLIAVSSAYQWLLDSGFDPKHIVIGADSAAATLALATLLQARDRGAAMPAATYLISPWVDMTVSNPSFEANASRDAYFHRDVVKGLAAMFLGNTDPRDPLASPAFAELAGLPPMYIQVGGDETLLDDARNLALRAEEAGVHATIDVFEGQQHTFQMAAGRAPEADDAIGRFAAWVKPMLV